MNLLKRIIRRLLREKNHFLPQWSYNISALDAHDFRSGLGDSAWVLYGLVRHYKPEVCVEIGSALGKSATYIASALQANQKGLLYAIDPHTATEWNDDYQTDSSLNIMSANLKKFDVSDRVEIMRGFSHEVGKNWSRAIDVLFIDGSHTYDDVKKDWELFAPHVKETGIVIVHDAMWEYMRDSPIYRQDMGVPKFLDELRNQGFPVITLPNDYGVSLVQTTRGGFKLVPESQA